MYDERNPPGSAERQLNGSWSTLAAALRSPFTGLSAPRLSAFFLPGCWNTSPSSFFLDLETVSSSTWVETTYLCSRRLQGETSPTRHLFTVSSRCKKKKKKKERATLLPRPPPRKRKLISFQHNPHRFQGRASTTAMDESTMGYHVNLVASSKQSNNIQKSTSILSQTFWLNMPYINILV